MRVSLMLIESVEQKQARWDLLRKLYIYFKKMEKMKRVDVLFRGLRP